MPYHCRTSVMLRTQRALTALACTCIGIFLIGPLLTHRSFFRSRDEEHFEISDLNFPDETVLKNNVLYFDDPSVKQPEGNVITILIWTYDDMTRWPDGAEMFKKCSLPDGKTCENIIDRNKYNSSEIILFHGQAINPNDIPAYRLPFHKWFFYEMETPPQTWIQKDSLEPIRRIFNFTSTITADSHVPIFERHRICFVNEDKYKELRAENVNYAEGKGSRVAWFVSHCETQSHREDYAAELSKHIPVDIVGKCGNITCGNKYQRESCDVDILSKKYKFYLSFENSICESYVTEKLWRLILQPISSIPIVMGGVDYKQVLPDKTYIDIKDFSSPKALAEFLKQIDADDKVFNEYITKKNAIQCKHPGNRWFHEIRYECELCKYLHEHRKDTTTVTDVLDFWSESRRCTPAEEYFKGSFDLKSFLSH